MTIQNFSIRRNGCVLKKKMRLGVDAMMLCYSALACPDVWRQQTQIPPVPQTNAREWWRTWYNVHKFHDDEQALCFVFDSRRMPFKTRRYVQRQKRIASKQQECRCAKSLSELEKALPGTCPKSKHFPPCPLTKTPSELPVEHRHVP